MTLKRRSSLSRSALPQRKKPVKRVNRVRKAKNWGRAYGSKERVAFVASLPCVVADTFLPCAGTIENAHIGTGGMGLKSGASSVLPLCTRHHLVLHRVGARHFEDKYGVDLKAEAARTEDEWQRINGAKLEQLVVTNRETR